MKRNNDEGGGGEMNIEKKTHHQLPHELIIEILLRLPLKSLLRFKCVCKLWFSLISDSHFATSHFDLTTAVIHTHRLVFITNSPTTETLSIDFQASLDDDAASLKFHFLLPQSYLTLQIGGSCRGFLFLHRYQDFYLWNPSTSIHKQIPCSPIVSVVDTRFFTYMYGFGYDPSTDDYLVVLGSYDTTANDVLTHLEFFSLRTNTWKEIEGAHLPYMNNSDDPRVGTLFNGAIHWLACCANISVNVIIAFDLMERRISEISLPNDPDFYHEPIDCDLWEFRGFMSLWAMGEDVVEIWVMKEYGVYSSWTKTLVLTIDHTQYFSPICSTNCGDIVGSDGSTGLMKYSDNGQLVEHRSYCAHPHGSQVALYTESLLPLPLPRNTQQA